MIEVEHLWKVYETVEAVRDLSFVVEPGEVLGLVGPNGAGKTSTMRCLCGIIPPSAGDIEICGLSMFESPVEAKRRVAFVPSEPRYFSYLTVWEHLQMFARLYDCGDQSERATELIASMSLTEKRDHLPESLSRGMQQKLMIACALIHEPQVLIFDEPFTGLDPLAIRNIRKILRECADAGAAVLLSSHLLAMVEDMVDRVLIIQGGQKVAHGSLEELAAAMPTLQQNADLEELFLHATGSQRSQSAEASEVSGDESVGDESAVAAANAGLPAPITTPVSAPLPASTTLDVVGGGSVDVGVDVGVLLAPQQWPEGPPTAPNHTPSSDALVQGGEGGAALPLSSSEVLPQYSFLEGSLASQDGLPAAKQGKWFAAEDDAAGSVEKAPALAPAKETSAADGSTQEETSQEPTQPNEPERPTSAVANEASKPKDSKDSKDADLPAGVTGSRE